MSQSFYQLYQFMKWIKIFRIWNIQKYFKSNQKYLECYFHYFYFTYLLYIWGSLAGTKPFQTISVGQTMDHGLVYVVDTHCHFAP